MPASGTQADILSLIAAWNPRDEGRASTSRVGVGR
jgi:hypothetical protein